MPHPSSTGGEFLDVLTARHGATHSSPTTAPIDLKLGHGALLNVFFLSIYLLSTAASVVGVFGAVKAVDPPAADLFGVFSRDLV